MLNYYCYPILLTICILLSCYEIKAVQDTLSYKLKLIGNISLCALLLRYICLVLLLISKNVIFLYYVKPFVFLEALALTVLTLLSCYIVVRNNYFKLYFIFIFFSLALAAFIIFIKKTTMELILTSNYGYAFKILNNINTIFIAIIIFNLLIFLIFILSRKNNKNILGSILIILSVVTLDIEFTMKLLNMDLFQEIVLWDFSVLLSYFYILEKRK